VQKLREAGVTAADGGYARLLAGLERAPETEVHQAALDITAQFGQGEVTPLGLSPPLEAVAEGPLAALDAADIVPTISVHMGEGFRDRRPEQREQTCLLVAVLAQVCDIRVVAGGLTARWLVEAHGDLLPRSFSVQCKTGEELDTPVDELVAAARERFDSDGRATDILRTLADEPAQTLSYHELVATTQVSASRVSQVLGELEDAQVIERYGPQSQRKVDLLPAGRTLVKQLDTEIGRQRSLDELFSDTGQAENSDVYSQPRERGPLSPSTDQVRDDDGNSPYHTRYLDRCSHVGAAAAGTVSDIVTVEGSLPSLDGDRDRHTRFVSFDSDRDEAVVAVRSTTPLQYIVSLATALASPRFLDEALPPNRLDSLDDPTMVLRQVRCIGALSAEAAEDGERFRDKLVEWGEELEEMTRKLHHEEYDDRTQFIVDILRDAHGLAGTIVHLLEAAEIDIVREIRVPSLPDDKLSKIARTVAISASIQSQYGAFATYRQLFEQREFKRETVPEPEVDAADPLGTLIGSIVLRGPRAKQLGWHMEGHLSHPLPIHEDAPEFAVEITVATPDRPAATAATTRMLSHKNMRATPEAVSLLSALSEDVHAICEALHWLASEEKARTVRLDEIRYALAKLDVDRLHFSRLSSRSHSRNWRRPLACRHGRCAGILTA
jgi:DNA-binding MarR family transcriptional regulator